MPDNTQAASTSAPFARLRAGLRDAAWLTGERARAYCRIFLALAVAGAVAWIALSHGGVDRDGKPLGSDFISFWTASKLALAGNAKDAYRPAIHGAAQSALMPGLKSGYFAFFYPPVYLLICLPLALLPYLAALAVWLGATLAAYWRVARAFAGRRIGLIPILAFPAVFVNAAYGQNGFLSMALLGGGLLNLRRRPIIAGLLFGGLIFKPHLGLMIPVALIALRRWTSVVAAAAAAAGLLALSWLVFGTATWHAFFAVSPLARTTLEDGLVNITQMQSSFAAVRLLGGSVPLAYAIQIVAAIAAAGALVAFIRARPASAAVGPALATATLLATPFLLDYDLTILAIPLGWLACQGVERGFLPWEKLIIALGFVLPLTSRLAALSLGVPITPIVMALVLAAILRRGLKEA